MTVKDLITELKNFPQDLPVVINYKEITSAEYHDSYYVIDDLNKNGYTVDQAVVLE